MLERSIYYILDAKGHQLSMYEHRVDTSGVNYYLSERNIYGSSRLGTTRDTVNMYDPDLLPSYGVFGNRNYELSNHLGNVLAVISDHIIPLDENTDDEVDGYLVGLVSVTDYSPFGVQLDDRTDDGCTYETVLEPESERVLYQNMVYAGNDISYVNSSGDLVVYPGTNGAGSSVQKIYQGESISWNNSPVVSENHTFVGLSYKDLSVGFGTINYAWYYTHTGLAYIFEDQVPLSGFSIAYTSGSEFKILREGGNIVYILDDVVYRTVTDVYPDSSMVADITINEIPGVDVTVRNLMINRMVEVQYVDCGEASGINRKYRYGYQSSERDDEVKGAGTGYTLILDSLIHA